MKIFDKIQLEVMINLNFYPIETADGSISLYNIDVKDVYHSKVGAYTEALHKYVLPSGILEFAATNNSVKILDVCYGLGYNARTAISEIIKINPEIEIHISALENDPVVLAFSTLVNYENYENNLNDLFFAEINNQINVEKILINYLEEIAHQMPYIKKLIPSEYVTVPPVDISSKLHNIYYRSLSSGKSIDKKDYKNKVFAEFYINDARSSLKQLDKQYDFIFHDPFTPSKNPVLWTLEFFNLLHNRLNNYGNLTTYSNAAPVRAAMIEAGFCIGQTEPVGKKTPGTIAYKNQGLVKMPLTEKEKGILQTKAGIPYRDKSLTNTSEEILCVRRTEQDNSNRISSGSFLKQYKKLPC